VLYLSFYFHARAERGTRRAKATTWRGRLGRDRFAAPLRFLHEAIGSVDRELAERWTPGPRRAPVAESLHLGQRPSRYSWFAGSFPALAMSLYQELETVPEHYNSWAWRRSPRTVRMHARDRFTCGRDRQPVRAFAAA